jgi:hypothetical protein
MRNAIQWRTEKANARDFFRNVVEVNLLALFRNLERKWLCFLTLVIATGITRYLPVPF